MNYDILALGDCNTLGDREFKHNSYVERFAKSTKLKAKNCGYTMSTTREMLYFYDKFYCKDIKIIMIQYGLVDSWQTFKYAPYVLYYPDNFFRKIARKFIKKYKKIARKFGLNKKFGEKFVVPLKEYKKNIEYIIQNSKKQKIFLIDTIPNRQIFRNKFIKQYNNILDELSFKYQNCYKIDLYEIFESNLDRYYLDDTHINNIGYEVVTQKILEVYKNCLES